MSWNARSIASEARRNVAADRGRTLAHVAGWAAIIAAIVLAEFTTIGGLKSVADERDADGINVMISTSSTGIDAASCAALDHTTYVRAVGGITEIGITSLDNLAGTEFVAAKFTNRALSVLDPTLDASFGGSTGGTVYAGSVLAEELGLDVGESVQLDGQFVTVAGIITPSPRTESVDRWLLTSSPAIGSVDACWVEYTPSTASRGLEINAAALVSNGDVSPETHELIRLDARSRDLADEFAQRQLVVGWPAAAAIGLLITIGALWSRRAELALYRTVGMSTGKMMLLVQFEVAIIIGIATTIGALVSMAALPLVSATIDGPYALEEVLLVARTVVLVAGTAFVIAPFFVAVLGRNTMALLKDR